MRMSLERIEKQEILVRRSGGGGGMAINATLFTGLVGIGAPTNKSRSFCFVLF